MLPVPARPALGPLVREDLQSAPGRAREAAEEVLARRPHDARAQLNACLAALTAGEPKRALARLEPSDLGPRVTAALTAWARQLDGNWYPGDVSAEFGMELEGTFVETRPGETDEETVEQVVRNGPTALFAPRRLIEAWLRDGAVKGAQQAAGAAWTGLDTLSRYATAHGLPDLTTWAVIAGADLAARLGLPQADELLADVRGHAAALGDDGRLAWTYLVEGDWYAAPGSCPEALGWDLAPQQNPGRSTADLRRAADCYGLAEGLLGAADVPRLRAALALRRAFLARAAGDAASRRCHVMRAVAGFDAAGDSAGHHLAAMHALVGNIDDGRLGEAALDLGGGWHRPARGPVADALAWAETVGSRSWCVGLGRLLERCGDHWTHHRSVARSRIAYLAALHLVSVDPTFPSQTLVTAVADADIGNNLSTDALLRLERSLGPLFADTSTANPYAFPQKLEASITLITALRHQSHGPAAAQAADRLALLGRQLAEEADRFHVSLPPVEGPVPTEMREQQAALDAMRGDGSLTARSDQLQAGALLSQHSFVAAARHSIDRTDVYASLNRAEVSQHIGWLAEAERWFDRAIEAASRPGAEPHLLPQALVSAQRFDEARAVLLARGRQIPDEIQLLLWLRVEDFDNALATFERMEEAGFAAENWTDLLSVAQLRLARGEHTEARRIALEAVAAFEDRVRLLLRDPERLEACDQPDVADLYGALALTHLPGAGPPTTADAEASFEAAELLRSLTSDSGSGRADPASRRTWQRAAAQYAAAANRFLAGNPSATGERLAAGFAELDALNVALAAAEHTVDTQDSGILLRRTARPPQPPAAQLRRRMPENTLLLEYLTVGNGLLSWAMTRDTVRPAHVPVRPPHLARLVRDFHTGCAEGRAPATELTQLLLGPFTDLLRAFPRVVVVPFGPLSLVPFHALPLDGTPLALSHVVSYAQRAAGIGEHEGGLDRPVRATRPLLVADPAFDPAAHPHLERLPGSRTEAAAVAEALGVPADGVLVGPAATEAAVGARLDDCDLLHVSSHGHLDEWSPFASSLILAGRDELTVADITGLRFATDLAVLTGCDTGRGKATLGGDLIGLTRSLLRSGVRRTVVSLWPVDDGVAPVVMARFYAALAGRAAPADALARAQRSVHAMSAGQLSAAYTALGGDPDTDIHRRRGREIDPELLDEHRVPEPMGGDAERYWAPFVIVE
ncbi:CHAT domain-containing protein [Streptomyces virginiae]|uniref:CHAT domain-containing protein n=1 Tax=Streptomyces virginiae TaxID=1961 RepID=UPI003724B1DE